MPPPKSMGFARRPVSPTLFRKQYDRGDLPVNLNHSGGNSGKLQWKVNPSQLNYNHYLPIFFDGLREKQDPYRFLSVQGCMELLDGGGAKIFHVIPQLIIPIKKALNTRDPEIMAITFKVSMFIYIYIYI